MIIFEKNCEVYNDLNVVWFEEVEIFEYISYKFDKYIDIKELISFCLIVKVVIEVIFNVFFDIIKELGIRICG